MSGGARRLSLGEASERPLLAAGVHDAVSARLAEEAGYDALWVSGLGVSLAQRMVPDVNIVSLSDMLSVTRHVVESTRVPVLVDADNGYGNAVNTAHAARAFELAGASGLCIEDNAFPKRNSFYEASSRELIDPDEMCGKIRAAVEARSDPGFVVVARTEAIIAGRSPAEAAERASAYAEAGADAVLIHGCAWEPIAEAARLRRGAAPLVLVPTRYAHVPLSELAAVGARLVIHANHGLRAAVAAMSAVYRDLLTAARASDVEPRIAPLEELFRLVDLDGMIAAESRYAPAAVRARRALSTPRGAEWLELVRASYDLSEAHEAAVRALAAARPVRVERRAYGHHEHLGDPRPDLRVCRLALSAGTSTTAHLHARKSHFFFVEAGELTCWVEGEGARTLRAGESCFIEAGRAHQLRNESAGPLSLLEVMRPATFEDKQILLHAPAERSLADAVRGLGLSDEAVARYRDALRSTSERLAAGARLRLNKPYGTNTIFHLQAEYGLSLVRIQPGQSTSRHYHQRRRELFYVRSGVLTLEQGSGTASIHESEWGQSTPGEPHQLANRGDVPVELIEVFTPGLLDDKVRLSDRYGRNLGPVHHKE